MTELPIISYEIQVGTEVCKMQNQPLILQYKWLGGINNEMGDTRRLFDLLTNIEEVNDEFKITFHLHYSIMGNFTEYEGEKTREFLFRPTDKTGEAITNEVLIWIRLSMAVILSGSN